MSRDSVEHTFLVALVLCVVCSLLVSAAAVGLRPRQLQNRERERQKNILRLTKLYDENVPVEEAFGKIETRVVDLETGEFVSEEEINPDTFDQRRAAGDPQTSVAIPADQDVANIRRREKFSLVYLVMQDGQIDQIVLPVYGKGLWSTMYGYLSLDADRSTVRGISFYEHGETPGLGGEIDNPAWKASWIGKRVFDDQGKLQLRVIKGTVDTSQPEAEYEIDGISGATITANGVSELVQYWLGEHAFGPLLGRMASSGAKP